MKAISLFLFFLECGVLKSADFAFGNTQGSNMVLQQAPNRAKVWGMSSYSDKITVTLYLESNQQLIETVHTTTNNDSLWEVYLNPRKSSFDQYMITAKSSMTSKQLSLNNILFGDVFICSGQSNMQFTVDQAFNASQELKAANNYPYIRLFTATLIGSPTPQINLIQIAQKWSVASNTSVGGGNWTYFSALCWFFGRNLFQQLNYPLGLIGTDYGGTPIRYWSSPPVNAQCNETVDNDDNFADYRLFQTENVPKLQLADSQLWNAMIYPFLQTTIKGAIWYQGESDCDTAHASLYACAFPAMINDWRLQWSLRSDTSADFPFGFIHLSVWNDEKGNVTCGNNEGCTIIPTVRWGQTANYGYVPNPTMINTFMATAIDLGDPTSPFSDIHPRYKQQAAKRLSDAAMNQIYGNSQIYVNGPIAYKAMISGNNLMINFRNVNEQGLDIRNSKGFEVNSNNNWVEITNTISANGNFNVVVPLGSNTKVMQVRYNWFQAPCEPTLGIYNCAVYDKESNLPALPFIMDVSSS